MAVRYEQRRPGIWMRPTGSANAFTDTTGLANLVTESPTAQLWLRSGRGALRVTPPRWPFSDTRQGNRIWTYKLLSQLLTALVGLVSSSPLETRSFFAGAWRRGFARCSR